MTRNARMTGTCYEDGCRRRGDACGAETEQGGGREGETDRWARREIFLFLFFSLGCDTISGVWVLFGRLVMADAIMVSEFG